MDLGAYLHLSVILKIVTVNLMNTEILDLKILHFAHIYVFSILFLKPKPGKAYTRNPLTHPEKLLRETPYDPTPKAYTRESTVWEPSAAWALGALIVWFVLYATNDSAWRYSEWRFETCYLVLHHLRIVSFVFFMRGSFHLTAVRTTETSLSLRLSPKSQESPVKFVNI